MSASPIYAPFTDQQVRLLNQFQLEELAHPFTCPRHDSAEVGETVLTATRDGWVCPREGCDYTQDWAHDYMADPQMHAQIRRTLREG